MRSNGFNARSLYVDSVPLAWDTAFNHKDYLMFSSAAHLFLSLPHIPRHCVRRVSSEGFFFGDGAQ